MRTLLDSAADAIGRTPLLRLNRITSSLGLDGTIVAKLDYLNPGVERARMMAALGAEVVLVDQMPGSVPGQVSGPDLQLVEERAKQIEFELGAFRADQFTRDGNWLAHYDGTGTELWEQTNGNLDGFVDYVGSGGTYAVVTKRLKALNPSSKCFIVEPHGAAVLAKQPISQPEHPIQGGGYVMPDLII
ncbi:cysteine synthase A [Colletotrichum nymphaeae SA-01]|uniref:Cysteine synthase A n=1 Tax=Colletotrichum nymphaeae SA-01 TaxID=1460502 RepID=A0A135SYP3_9PEZI|nr:cysteine synthase A [Colletotrichum nymphaeae SA-01]